MPNFFIKYKKKKFKNSTFILKQKQENWRQINRRPTFSPPPLPLFFFNDKKKSLSQCQQEKRNRGIWLWNRLRKFTCILAASSNKAFKSSQLKEKKIEMVVYLTLLYSWQRNIDRTLNWIPKTSASATIK